MANESPASEANADSYSFQNVPRALLVILRVHLAVIFLITDFGKMFLGGSPFSVEMLGFLQNYAMKNASAPYQNFLQSVVIPHATLFSYLIMAGELVAGISLLLGLGTRLGALIAMFLFLNYMFAKGQIFWSPNSQDAGVFFSGSVCCLGAAGRVYGLDAFLARRWPSIPLW